MGSIFGPLKIREISRISKIGQKSIKIKSLKIDPPQKVTVFLTLGGGGFYLDGDL